VADSEAEVSVVTLVVEVLEVALAVVLAAEVALREVGSLLLTQRKTAIENSSFKVVT
jgi:hypothetical protein